MPLRTAFPSQISQRCSDWNVQREKERQTTTSNRSELNVQRIGQISVLQLNPTRSRARRIHCATRGGNWEMFSFNISFSFSGWNVSKNTLSYLIIFSLFFNFQVKFRMFLVGDDFCCIHLLSWYLLSMVRLIIHECVDNTNHISFLRNLNRLRKSITNVIKKETITK